MNENSRLSRFGLLVAAISFCGPINFAAVSVHAQEFQEAQKDDASSSAAVELNGDIVEYSMNGNKITASGNVKIVHQDTVLTCDRVEFSRDTSIARAEGNVQLRKGVEEINGDAMTFNFATMKGEFSPARIAAYPYYGEGKTVSRVDDNHIVMKKGFLTTCDHDNPHYRLFSPTACRIRA